MNNSRQYSVPDCCLSSTSTMHAATGLYVNFFDTNCIQHLPACWEKSLGELLALRRGYHHVSVSVHCHPSLPEKALMPLLASFSMLCWGFRHSRLIGPPRTPAWPHPHPSFGCSATAEPSGESAATAGESAGLSQHGSSAEHDMPCSCSQCTRHHWQVTFLTHLHHWQLDKQEQNAVASKT